jgi:hypothetical protein
MARQHSLWLKLRAIDVYGNGWIPLNLAIKHGTKTTLRRGDGTHWFIHNDLGVIELFSALRVATALDLQPAKLGIHYKMFDCDMAFESLRRIRVWITLNAITLENPAWSNEGAADMAGVTVRALQKWCREPWVKRLGFKTKERLRLVKRCPDPFKRVLLQHKVRQARKAGRVSDRHQRMLSTCMFKKTRRGWGLYKQQTNVHTPVARRLSQRRLRGSAQTYTAPAVTRDNHCSQSSDVPHVAFVTNAGRCCLLG